MAPISSGVRPMVVPAPAVFSISKRVWLVGTAASARRMASDTLAIAPSRSPSVAAPG